MSGRIRYSDEFKIEAVAQVTERGYSVKEVAERFEISTKSRGGRGNSDQLLRWIV